MNLELINENRELYDLCRKYKHYYKQYQDVRHLKDKYYSKYLYQAYQEAEKNLNKTLMEMLHYLFKNTGALTEVKIETEEPFIVKSFLGDIALNNSNMVSTTHILSHEFALLMQELLHWR